MSIFEAQLWCLAAMAVGMILGWIIAWLMASDRFYTRGWSDAMSVGVKQYNEFAQIVKTRYQPKPKRDKNGRFISPAKAKQKAVHASLEREVAAKKGRLL